ncbi:ribonuclease H2 subunit B isoform X2 [Adelges cooleyi]|uniref:ribonuclease H2 subunit B isoform X2 n=1 Tax=Adelges cooleyi TaxID=133065 RepID=UPI00217F6D55|nr:ribonuclease H2 subunit B isoform X2 [Adelges cooleyi]
MAPRGKKVADKKKESELADDDRLFILPDKLLNNQNGDARFIKLRHPQTGDLSIFLYSEQDKVLSQIRSLPLSHRSFFKGDEVIPINKIDFVSPVDPLFLILPYLIKSSSMFSPLDQILIDEELPELNTLLMNLSKIANVKSIINKKECGDLELWQLNENNMMKLLNNKVEKVAKVLIDKQINVNPNAAVSTTFKLSVNLQATEEQYKRYAFSIVSEYLPVSVQTALLGYLGLPEKVENNKRKADDSKTAENKKVKHSEPEYSEKTYKVEKVVTPKQTAKDKALQKAASDYCFEQV